MQSKKKRKLFARRRRKMENLLDDIIAYENGEMEWDSVVVFFQKLINNGMAWSLQGHYGRKAMAMIEEGYCVRKK
jgi:hypothetical protein